MEPGDPTADCPAEAGVALPRRYKFVWRSPGLFGREKDNNESNRSRSSFCYFGFSPAHVTLLGC
jgi:hypothetical protein